MNHAIGSRVIWRGVQWTVMERSPNPDWNGYRIRRKTQEGWVEWKYISGKDLKNPCAAMRPEDV